MQEQIVTQKRTARTPGPWLSEAIPHDAHLDREIGIDEDSLFWIAEARTAGQVIATVERLGDSTEANARLIAVAPDMLRALQNVESYFFDSRMTADVFDALVADVKRVIAKAEGAR